MVPLRVEECSRQERPARQKQDLPQGRPQLILHDVGREETAAPPVHTRRRKSGKRWDALLFTMAAASVLLFFLCSVGSFAWQTIHASYLSSLTPTLKVTVSPGDTLWKYAVRYGSPNRYILDRIETIARDNHLSSTVPLMPGQHLQIAVQNPVVLAQLEQQHRIQMASLVR